MEHTEEARHYLEDARWTPLRARGELENTRNGLPDVPDPHLVWELRRELHVDRDRSSRPSSENLEGVLDGLRIDEEEMLAKLARADQARREDGNSLKESLYAALAESREQVNDYRARLRELTEALDREMSLRAAAELMRDEHATLLLAAQEELQTKTTENEVLVSMSEQARMHRDFNGQSTTCEQQRELESAQARITVLEAQLQKYQLEYERRLQAEEMTRKEGSVRDEIRMLQDERASTLHSNLQELEEERRAHVQHIEELQVKLKQSNESVEQVSATTGRVTAVNEQLQQDKDKLARDCVSLRERVHQLLTTQQQQQSAIAPGPALDQRDTKSQQPQRTRRQPDSGAAAELMRSKARITQLETLVNKLSSATAGVGSQRADPDTSLYKSLLGTIDRNARIELAANQTIHNLETSLAMEQDKVARLTHQLTLTSSHLPNNPRPCPGTQPPRRQLYASDADALEFMQGKQLELDSYKRAARLLQAFCQRQVVRDGAHPLSSDEVRQQTREAALAIQQARLDDMETLPAGWEAMTTPEGLVYFVDHRERCTTWTHPGLLGSMVASLVRRQPDDEDGDQHRCASTLTKLRRSQARHKSSRRAANKAR